MDMSPEFNFGDAFAEAEAAALAEAPPVEDTVAEETPSERQRNELGQFVAADETPAEDPVDTVEDTPAEAAAADPDVEAYLSKYGGDTDKALRAAVEAQKLLGKQGSELGELRRTLEERFNAVEEKISAPTQQQYDAQQIQEAFDENPAAIIPTIQQAWQTGNRQVVYQGVAALAQYDPAKAEEFRVAIAREDAKQDMQQYLAPMAAQTAEREQAAAIQALVVDLPDIKQFIQSDEITAAATEFPVLGDLVANGSPAQQAEAIKTLFLASRGRASDTLKANVQDVARVQAEEARKAAEDAYVASTTTATATESVQETEADQIANSLLARSKSRQDAWNNGWERH